MFGLGQFPDADARLNAVVDLMRAVSRETDPQKLVLMYGQRMAHFMRSNRFCSVSRRGLSRPRFRVTRATVLDASIDPWRDRDKLPLLEGGAMVDVIYSDRPLVMDVTEMPTDDPIRLYFGSQAKRVLCIPHYEAGEALNWVCHIFDDPARFDPADFPEMVWASNLFGRGVGNLALSRDLQTALDALDRELKAVEDMQQSLLPQSLPELSTLRLATHYQTSRHAGGDYFDFFHLGENQLGIFLADVSGHGTAAAVVMAVTHALAHNYPGRPVPPALMMHYLNQKLSNLPTSRTGNFVTAFFGIYDGNTRTLAYSSAGHPEARLLRAGAKAVEPLSAARALPLGILPEETYAQASVQLAPGDRFLLFTDGITESFSPAPEHDMFGLDRLDHEITASEADPQAILNRVLEAVGRFTGSPRGEDDRTMVAGVVS
jgi:phosphoserine phosphatase RsbU/P